MKAIICCDNGYRNYKLEKILLSQKWKDGNNGFGNVESQEEYVSSIQHRLLTQLWLQFDYKYGISIDELIGDDDPTEFIRTLQEVRNSLKENTSIPVTVVHKQQQSLRPRKSIL